ncbi:hypothetical protein KO481_06640 [Nocardia sp. NEAU-G5]|uniref:Teneurin-like YD-shell domain-containing protein n=1 Tax=Nocardia albiluteola TaxID=2842303 RepID=A0ABS6AW06_9NOCA|nr:RHS repeat-associated core domain-containing protein [Nocardia albiluteola]MBU3061199.1 hypothetical protein [Nocardia albiluteola]
MDQSSIDRSFYAIVTDLAGTPTELITSSTGQTVAAAVSNLWGKTSWRGYASTTLRFPGQIYDPETEIHYNHHRYYDPDTGRFTTTDPLGLAPSSNPFTYPHNSTIWSDPLGLTPCKEPTASAGASLENISPSDARRIQNAANSRGVVIHVVGSRAKGTAHAESDWDYVIAGINSRMRSRIQSSLPMGSQELGYGRRIDIFRGKLNETEPHITFYPN